MSAIKTILCYPNLLPFEPTEANVNAFMESMATVGVTHVQVNHLPDLMHPEQFAQPDNVYLGFANFGPPLDLFVTSRLNAGLWPEMYLDRNRRTLLSFAAAARRHGLQPVLYLCEPRFVPERFFRKHPTLRGPRVDNPTCSKTPLYALCTDRAEVLDHYREMMAKMMDLAPDLALATIFTSDSGAGFDYNPTTYAGPNGAAFNRRVPLERRVVRFLTVLLEEGRRKNPGFTVHLTSGFSPEDRAKILQAAPAAVVGSVYGLYDWAGGLEEQWGYHQAVWGEPRAKWNIRNLDRAQAAADRFADMKQRLEVARQGGRSPIVHAELPTTDYPRPLRYTPHPFETIRVMQDLVRLGAHSLAAWGVINPKTLVPYDVNAEAMRLINEQIDAEAAALVTSIAQRWVGQPHAAALVEAWQRCDHAWTHRPLWTHVGLTKYALPGPLVPDLICIKREEIAYYRTMGLDDLELIQGLGHWVPFEADERNRDFVLHEIYEQQTLPGLRGAAEQLERMLAHAQGEARAALQCQRDHIQLAFLIQRSHYNWYETGRYLAPGRNPGHGRPMVRIVDDEIENTWEMIRLLDGRLEQFMRVMPSDHMTYEFGPGFVNQLKQRIAVMQAHRADAPRVLPDRWSQRSV